VLLGYTEGTFYVVVVLVTFVFFAYCGIKLYLELKKSNKTISDPESRMKKLRRVSLSTLKIFSENFFDLVAKKKKLLDYKFHLDEQFNATIVGCHYCSWRIIRCTICSHRIFCSVVQ